MSPEASAIETAFKLYGAGGAAFVALALVVVFIFRRYEAAQAARFEDAKARIEDAKAYAAKQEQINDRILPYVAKLARRTERITRALRLDDSDPPPELEARTSRIDIGEGDTSTRIR